MFKLLLLFVLSIIGAQSKSFNKKDDAVLLSNVRSLTLNGQKSTSHRRVEAIPQLTCVGGNACSYYEVDMMRCENSGSEYDAEDIQWTCRASLPTEFKLGSTEVVCEGYDGPDDPYVLKGSCGVEYRLVLTDLGEEKYGYDHQVKWSQKPFSGKENDEPGTKNNNDFTSEGVQALWTLFFWVVFIAICGTILYKIFRSFYDTAVRNQNRIRLGDGPRGGGGGGGDDDDNDDPPPPYTPHEQPRPKPAAKTTAPMAWTSTQKTNTPGQPETRNDNETNDAGPSSSNNEQWRPGFWAGAATGAAAAGAAGYYAGSRQQNPEMRERNDRARRYEAEERERRDRMEHEHEVRRRQLERHDRERREEQERRQRMSLFNSPSPPSTSRHESTGFGGTRRR